MNKAINDPRTQLSKTIDQLEGAYAPATIRAYKTDFLKFIECCDENKNAALPAEPESLAQFIRKLADNGCQSASIRRAIAGISTIHRLNRLMDPSKDPIVNLEMKRMHRRIGRCSNQAQAITADILEQLLAVTDDSQRGIRDRALLLIAYDTLCRRSELVSLQIQDIKTIHKGSEKHTTILLRRSKTDQQASGRWLYLSQKATTALYNWLSHMPDKEGPIFRGISPNHQITKKLGANQINRIYKNAAIRAKIDESVIQRISGHSCRIGATQDLVAAGASLPIIMSRGRWSKTDTVMRYAEQVNLNMGNYLQG